ncbi:MAG: CYTH and CHAD domain-containing protein, partial [Alphaproteobacteria bacterium]|nr:CYTH and CHAD domain-containing protein [Alphaproteobacteria bacterium]
MDLKGTEKSPEPDAAITREVELNLRASPAAIAQLLASPLLSSGIPGLSGSQKLDAAYYDTTDRRLHKRGVSLRIRREGQRFIQTVETTRSTTGVFDRREWETIVPDFCPRPDWVMDSGARALLGHLASGELEDVCRTIIQRKTRVIGYKNNGATALIEIAFDVGTLEAGDVALPTAEVELELLKGSRHALYSLALELHEIAPLQIEYRSKAERAYAMFAGQDPQMQKAKKLRFAADATVDYSIAAVFENCLSHWQANETAVLEGDNAEALHQMRVALRRTRSALNLFGSVLPLMQAGWLKTESRWIARALGSARNWDVFLDDVLVPLEAKRPGDTSLAALRQQCLRARARNYETAREAIRSPRYTTFVLNFNRWLEEAGWHSSYNKTRSEILAAPLEAFADTILEQQH